jgi:hypothetical protein
MWCSEENIAIENIAIITSESLNSFLTQKPLQDLNLTKDQRNKIAVDRSLYYYTYPESPLENYYIELVRETTKNSEESNVTKISPNDVEILNSWKAKRSNWYLLIDNFLRLRPTN